MARTLHRTRPLIFYLKRAYQEDSKELEHGVGVESTIQKCPPFRSALEAGVDEAKERCDGDVSNSLSDEGSVVEARGLGDVVNMRA